MTTIDSPAFPHIVRDAAILGGEPVVKGTRVPVRTVAILCRLYHTMAAVRAAYPMLTAEQIDEALAYYGAHWEEIERFVAENEDDGD
jgi:uncharacterized protein (DUF433 family)